MWIVERWGADFSTTLNPSVSVGVDLPRDMMRHLGRVLIAEPAATENHKGIKQ